MAKDFRLTGKHILGILIGFFLIILSANVIFINYAVKTFPGEQEKKSYLQGLNFNERLAAREKQSELAWTAKIDAVSLADGNATIALSIAKEDGAPIYGLDITAVLSRPASAAEDYAVEFSPGAGGQYTASAPADPGVWVLKGKAVNRANDEFEFVNRLILQ